MPNITKEAEQALMEVSRNKSARITALEAKLYAVQRELITHVVWSRSDDEGDRAYECDLCEVRDVDAGCAEDLKHKGDCILFGCENPV